MIGLINALDEKRDRERAELRALNAELLATLKEALWAFESPNTVGPTMIKIQKLIAKVEEK